jgi:hypothetical protein
MRTGSKQNENESSGRLSPSPVALMKASFSDQKTEEELGLSASWCRAQDPDLFWCKVVPGDAHIDRRVGPFDIDADLTGAFGQPEVAAEPSEGRLQLTISHTRGLVACAIARHEGSNATSLSAFPWLRST